MTYLSTTIESFRRMHIELISQEKSLVLARFGIMSYIGPYLRTLEHEQEEIRNGLRTMTPKFLSLVNERWTSVLGSQAEIFRDAIEAVSLLDSLNYSSTAWNEAVDRWLIKYEIHDYKKSD